jgi:hypothetical protein
MGESVGLIYKKISQVMADIGSIGKERQNREQNYKFRGIEDLYNAAQPAMIKHGIFCAPSVLEYQSNEYMTAVRGDGSGGKRMQRVIMRVQHRFYAEDGSFVETITSGEGVDQSDKAANKCMSAAFKYALMEIFCVPTEDIEDADRTTPGSEEERRLPVEPKTFNKPAEAPLPEAVKPRTRKPKAETQPEKADTEVSQATTTTDAYIPLEKQDWLRLTFRKRLPAQYRGDLVSETFRKGWLKSEGFINDKDEGTSTLIRESEFVDVAKRMLDWAEAQAVAPEPQQPDPDIPF